MTDLPHLIRAVRRGDDPRAALVLADWLEEYGDLAERGRAEHLRTEMRPRLDHALAGDWIEARLAELREAHGPAWLGKLHGLRGVSRWSLDRGLLWVWLRPAILKKGRLALVAGDPWLEGVRCEGWAVKELRRLLADPALGRIPCLEILNCPPGPLALNQRLESLERLRLVGCGLDGRVLSRLVREAHLPALRVLEAPYNRIGSAGLAALARSSLLARLERLDLESNRIGPRGARALAASPHLGKLHLRLGFNRLGDRGAIRLGPAVGKLASLDLSWNGIGPDGGTALAAAPSLPPLRLEGNDLGPALAALRQKA
ncbi:MAG: hypothetical protein K2W96_02905 [Gemmataceae bacterium]|nr:hypothetical protein [Gemmataceae bacterium]